MDVELIRELEEAAARAWPAETEERLDGWILRFNHGITRRANSVLAIRQGGQVPLREKLAAAAAFYTSRGLPPRFHVSPVSLPAGLDAELDARGYTIPDRTCVQTAHLETFRAGTGAGDGRVVLSPNITDPWFDTYWEGGHGRNEVAAGRQAIFARIADETAYALLEADGRTAAIGLGVLAGGWLGIFGMVTRPEHRGRGLARAVLAALAGWGATRGAQGLYLQVAEANAPARRLYEWLGFTTLYHYHYRERL